MLLRLPRKRYLVGLLLTLLFLCLSSNLLEATHSARPPARQTWHLAQVGHVGGQVRAVATDGELFFAALGQELAVFEPDGTDRLRRVGTDWLPLPISGIVAQDSYIYLFGNDHFWIRDVIHSRIPRPRGQVALDATVEDMAVVGAYAYLATSRGLQILSVADPDRPFLVAELAPPPDGDTTTRIAVAGQYAYLIYSGRWVWAVQVVSVAEPASPIHLTTLWNYPYDLALLGHALYLATGSGLQIFDVTDPAQPQHVTTYRTGPVTDLFLDGTTLYLHAELGEDAASVLLVDLTDPFAPQTLGSYEAAAVADLAASDERVLLAQPGQLTLLDVSTPAQVAPLGHYRFPAEAVDVALAGPYAYIASRSGVHVQNLSDPLLPESASWLPAPSPEDDLTLVERFDHYVYAAGSSKGLIYDIVRPAAPVLIGTDPQDFPTCLSIQKQNDHWYAYSTANFRLHISDLTTPAAPQPLADVPTFFQGGPVVSDGAFIYTLGFYDQNLWIFDARDPAVPRQVARLSLPGPGDLALSGNWLYLAGSQCDEASCHAYLLPVDLSNPSAPVPGNSFTPPGYAARQVEVAGDRLYLLVGDRLVIYDTSNPGMPAELATYPVAALGDGLVVSGHYAYFTDYDLGLQIVDVGNPAEPALVGNLPLANAGPIAIDDPIVYVGGLDGLYLVDATNPARPVQVGAFPWPEPSDSGAEAIFVAGDTAFVTIDPFGEEILLILDVSHPATPHLLGEMLHGRADFIAPHEDQLVVTGEGLTLLDPTPLPGALPDELSRYDPSGANCVAVDGHYAYVSHQNGLRILDVQQPEAPHEIRYLTLPYWTQGALALRSTEGATPTLYLYLADEQGVRILDVTHPESPQEAGFFSIGYAIQDLVIADSKAYLSLESTELAVLDLSHPAEPVLLTAYTETPGWAGRVYVSDNMVALADGDEGLFLFDLWQSEQAQYLLLLRR